MEENKKKEIATMTKVIVVILFVLFFVLGFFLGRNLVKDNDKKEEIKNQEEKIKEQEEPNIEQKEEIQINSELYSLEDGEIDLNNEELQKYINMYKLYDEVEYDLLLKNAADGKESARLTLATRLLNDSDIESVECKTIKKDNIAKYFDSLYYDIGCGETSILSDDWANNQSKTKLIKKETIEKYLKYYYGENTIINDTKNTFRNLNSKDCFSYYYQEDLDSYVEIKSWCGGAAPTPSEKIDKVTKQNDKLIIESTMSYDDIPDKYSANVILTLVYEKSTNHYIFQSRDVVKK